MKTIDIVGNGVAAVIMAYIAGRQCRSVRVWAPGAVGFNAACPGARFINCTDGMSPVMLDAMAASQRIPPAAELATCRLGGGVMHYLNGVAELIGWSELLDDKGLALRMTREYARSTGRAWSPDCLFSVLDWNELPLISRFPDAYSVLVSYMAAEASAHSVFMPSGVYAVGNGTIVSTDGESYACDTVCNTVPLWASTFLPIAVPRVTKTAPRYASVHETPHNLQTGVPSITYVIHGESEPGPMKRTSYDGGHKTTVEYWSDPGDVDGLVQLPPNIHMLECSSIEAELAQHGIFLMGRFAQMRPKMHLNDMFLRAAEILSNT